MIKVATVLLLFSAIAVSENESSRSYTCEEVADKGKSIRNSGQENLYVVKTSEYRSRSYISEFIKRVLSNMCCEKNKSKTFVSDWAEVERPYSHPGIAKAPSDFALLRLSSDIEMRQRQMRVLESQSLVHSVQPEIRYAKRRVLQATNRGGGRKRTHFPSNLVKSTGRWTLDSWLRGSSSTSRRSMAEIFDASAFWAQNITGQGVRVAVFDTGIKKNHPHIRNLIERSVWTDENTMSDGVGHGTFVSGVIASDRECLGFAPDAHVYSFKVFTNEQVSYTSWFLDALNYAMFVDGGGVDVINLSIGGPDYLDAPFVEKLREVLSKGIIVVSAIGNDGPTYGSAMNPADELGTIGVGGITRAHTISDFSSRGMTTWELDGRGYGRVKPDIVTYAEHLIGSDVNGGCRRLSGTSVASPVIAGVVTLLLSIVPPGPWRDRAFNPANVKQALIDSALRLDGPHIFEQGPGVLRLKEAAQQLAGSLRNPRVSLLPDSLDLRTESCSYMWPYCTQPMYAGAMPIVVNTTILNPLDVRGYVVGEPRWIPGKGGEALDVSTEYPDVLWPWSGYVAVFLRVRDDYTHGEAVDSFVAEGVLEIRVSTTPPSLRGSGATTERTESTARLPVKATVLSKPPARNRRLLWDQFHSIQYPSGHIPRDNLDEVDDVLDWRADHLHTNFRRLFDTLVSAGFYVEILYGDWTCFDASRYGALLLVDSEDIHTPVERRKLQCDVDSIGLGLIVVAEWYSARVMERIGFYDANTRRWWPPSTAGSNVPALNCLLRPFGISFGDRVFSGELSLNGRYAVTYASGSSIVRFPSGGRLLFTDELVDETNFRERPSSLLKKRATRSRGVASLGLMRGDREGRGNIAVFGDSQCMDESTTRVYGQQTKSCLWLVRLLARFATGTSSDDLTSYGDVETDIEAQRALSDSMTPNLERPYSASDSLSKPLTTTPEGHFERIRGVSNTLRFAPSGVRADFSCGDGGKKKVECDYPFERSAACLSRA